MNKKILFLCLMVLTAAIVWVAGGRKQAQQIGKLVPVSSEQHNKISSLINDALNRYNRSGTPPLRRVFAGGHVDKKYWTMTGVEDPVAKSLATLSECGTGLKLKFPEVKRRNSSAKNNQCFVITGIVNTSGDSLQFEIIKRKNSYRFTRISKI